jgi:hypothetical protein
MHFEDSTALQKNSRCYCTVSGGACDEHTRKDKLPTFHDSLFPGEHAAVYQL